MIANRCILQKLICIDLVLNNKMKILLLLLLLITCNLTVERNSLLDLLTLTRSTKMSSTDTSTPTTNEVTISYPNSSYTLTQNDAISTITATYVGTATGCTISPSLPSGLSISTSCEISGTPGAGSPKTTYTVNLTTLEGTGQTTLIVGVRQSAFLIQKGVAGVNSRADKLAIAPDTSKLICGESAGSLDGETLTGTEAAFFSLFNPGGTREWTKLLNGSTGSTNCTDVIAAKDGSGFYGVGHTTSSLGGNTLIGNRDIFLGRLDSSGNGTFLKTKGAAGATAYATGMDSDSSGNLYIGGYVNGAGLDGNTLTGSSDIFVIKYDSNGNWLGTVQKGVAGNVSYNYRIYVSSTDHIYISGSTQGSLFRTISSTYDCILIKLDTSLNFQWGIQYGSTDAGKICQGYNIVEDASGNLIVLGYTGGNFDGNTVTGSYDGFITKYTTAGSHISTKFFGSAGSTIYTYGMDKDSSHNIYVSGFVTSSLDGISVTGTGDAFVRMMDADGNFIRSKLIGSAGKNTYGNAIVVDELDDIYQVGHTYGSLDGNTLTGNIDYFFTNKNKP